MPDTEDRTEPVLTGKCMTDSTAIRRVALFSAFALVCFLAGISPTWPLSDDHIHYSFVGDTIMNGGVPYRDAWDLKGPLNYYVFGWARALLGRNEHAIRIFDLIIVSSFCWQLRSLVLRLNGKRKSDANLAVVFFLICYYTSGYYWIAQPDDWAGMLVLVAVSFLLDETRHRYVDTAAAGFAIALAILLKPTYIIFIPLMLLHIGRERILSADNIREFLAGLVVIVIVVSASYLWIFRNGGFQDLIDAMRFVKADYGSFVERILPVRLHRGVATLNNLGLVVPYCLAIVALWAIARSGHHRVAGLLGAWFVLCVVMLMYQGMYWYYEFFPATISVAVLFGVALGHAGLLNRNVTARYVSDGIIFLLLGMICLAPLESKTLFGAIGWPEYAFGHRDRADYFVQITEPGDEQYAIERLSRYLSINTGEKARIQIWGYHGLGALTQSNRSVATRFGTTWAVMDDTPVQSRYRQIFMEELSQADPDYIVVELNVLWDGPRPPPMWKYPEFSQYLHSHYELIGHVVAFQIWVRTTPSSAHNDNASRRHSS